MMNMKLEILSPVHIGIGDILSPYSDYIYKDGYVHYINMETLSEDLYKREDAEEIMDHYVELVKTNADRSDSKYKLVDFFQEYSLDVEHYTSKRAKVNGVLNSEQIQRIITSGSLPYIPGSSIKGALRTCILAAHLKEEGYDFPTILKYNKLYIGQDLFGSYGNDIFKFLHVSDSTPLSADCAQVTKTTRWDLLTQASTIPLTREVIPVGLHTDIRIQSKADKDYHHLPAKFSYLFEGREEEILGKVNDFYLGALKEEIRILSSYGNKEFAHILSFYQSLQQEILQLKEQNTGAILRVGAGKTFYENTINLYLQEADRQSIQKRLKGGNSKVFPKTRTVIMERDVIVGVLGWVKLCKV